MASDMAVALARATADDRTYFGHNINLPGEHPVSLVRLPGGPHAPDETVRTTFLELPQARITCAVLGCRTGNQWGLHHGINDKGVAIGCTAMRTRLSSERPGLSGPELVRLGLERSLSARHAVEVLTDLITRHGQGAFTGDIDRPDAALLITDAQEACLLEAAGSHWAQAQVGSVRAVSGMCMLRQDWDRISRGLADLAIRQGWWPNDGCKLDFAAALALPTVNQTQAVRRWGRATVALEQHSGEIDAVWVRRLLREQSESLGAPEQGNEVQTAGSMIVCLGREPDNLPVAWFSLGPPASGVWVPVLPLAELPDAYTDSGGTGSSLWHRLSRLRAEVNRNPRLRSRLRTALDTVQQQIDDLMQVFLPEAQTLYHHGRREELRRLAGSFVQHTCESLEAMIDPLEPRQTIPVQGNGDEELVGADF